MGVWVQERLSMWLLGDMNQCRSILNPKQLQRTLQHSSTQQTIECFSSFLEHTFIHLSIYPSQKQSENQLQYHPIPFLLHVTDGIYIAINVFVPLRYKE